MDVAAMPCASRYTAYDGRIVEPDETCIQDYEANIKYLGDSLNFIAYYNTATFQPDSFFDESILK